MKLIEMMGAFGAMFANENHPLQALVNSGHGHSSAGYATPGAFGRSRFGARRSLRRSVRMLEGKYTQR